MCGACRPSGGEPVCGPQLGLHERVSAWSFAFSGPGPSPRLSVWHSTHSSLTPSQVSLKPLVKSHPGQVSLSPSFCECGSCTVRRYVPGEDS